MPASESIRAECAGCTRTIIGHHSYIAGRHQSRRYRVRLGDCAARAAVADFNSDGHPDYVLRNASTHQTAIWYLNNNIYQGGAFGPSITVGWVLEGVADFNRDVHPDYALFNSTTDQTGIWYMSGPTRIGAAYGPTLPGGWELTETADFNGDGFPDYVLFNATTHQTAIWYLNNNVYVSGGLRANTSGQLELGRGSRF